MTVRQWLSVDLLTGTILAYLPQIEATQPLRRTLAQYDTASVNLHITDGIDPGWERAILEGASALICYTGTSGNEVIEWGGIVLQSPRDLTSIVQIALATPDAYLDRQYVGDYTATGRDQNLIATDLIGFANGTGKIPMTTVVTGAAGTARDRSYLDTGNQTVYSALQELSGLSGGPEWYMDWTWDHVANTILPVFTVGTRIGNAQRGGLAPNVTLEAPFVQSAVIGHDYSAGSGANRVTCYSSNQDVGAATETTTLPNRNGRPIWEYRYSPSTSIIHTTVLDAHALRALAAMTDGLHSITVSLKRDLPGYTFGVDWNLGDDIGYYLQSPSIPTVVTGVARVVAYETTPTDITPILKVVS